MIVVDFSDDKLKQKINVSESNFWSTLVEYF